MLQLSRKIWKDNVFDVRHETVFKGCGCYFSCYPVWKNGNVSLIFAPAFDGKGARSNGRRAKRVAGFRRFGPRKKRRKLLKKFGNEKKMSTFAAAFREGATKRKKFFENIGKYLKHETGTSPLVNWRGKGRGTARLARRTHKNFLTTESLILAQDER